MDLFIDWKPFNEKREETWATLAKMEKWVACRKACSWTPQIVGLTTYYLLAAVLPYYLLLGLIGSAALKMDADLTPLIQAVPLAEELWALELPWWGVLVGGFVGLYAVPLALALAAKMIAGILSRLLVREKKTPLPTDVIEREKSIHQRGSKLLEKYKNTQPPMLDGGTWMSYISIGITVVIPFVLACCTPAFIDEWKAAFDESWLGYVLLFGEGLVALAIPAFLLWMLFLWMSTLLNTMLDPLCEDKLYYKRREGLTCRLPTLYKRWIDVDPAERRANEKRARDIQKMKEKEAADKEALRMAMAGIYLREQKEHQAYLDDLHRWAHGYDDLPSSSRGSGDGI